MRTFARQQPETSILETRPTAGAPTPKIMTKTLFLPALMLLSLLPRLALAQQESLGPCLDKLAADPAYAVLAGKLALGANPKPVSAKDAESAVVSDKERPLIARWAAARAECLKADSRFGNDAYRPPLQAYGLEAENKVLAATEQLYDRKLTFADYNRQREAIAAELRDRKAQLNRRIEQQATTLEQAGRDARERERLQRDLDEAEWQTTLARQQAEQAQQQAAARAANRRADGVRRYQNAPVAPYRNCYRFGARTVCMPG